MTDCADNEALLEAVLNDSNQMVQVSNIETFSMMYANTPRGNTRGTPICHTKANTAINI